MRLQTFISELITKLLEAVTPDFEAIARKQRESYLATATSLEELENMERNYERQQSNFWSN